MSERVGRRSSKDEKWQEVKRIVAERDKTDRILPKLTISEYKALRRNAKGFLTILDPAHVIQVSQCGAMIYDEDNVILLNRYSHDNLDHNRCPVSGKRITRERVHEWWARIVGVAKYKELLTRAKESRV